MELIETKESLQPEYDKLISELDELRILYTEIKKKHGEMELKDLELYYELEELSDKLKEDTKIDEENEKQYIENNCNKLAIKLLFTCGGILSLFIFIVELITGILITNTILSLCLIIGHLSSGIIIGIGIYFLYSKRYQSILKDKYKQTDIHRKYSTDHYDKIIKLMGKKEKYNKYHQEYLDLKDECVTLESSFLDKQEELKQFKEKVFETIFHSKIEEINKNEESLTKEDNLCFDKCYSGNTRTCKKTLRKY